LIFFNGIVVERMIDKERNYLILGFEFPPHPGGIGTYTYQIAKNMHQMGYKVVVLITHNQEPEEIALAFDNSQPFTILRFNKHNLRVIDIISRFKMVLQVVKKYNVQAIHVCSWAAGVPALLAKYLFKINYIQTGYGTEFLMKKKVNNYLLGKELQHADVLISISEYTKRLMKRHIANKKIPVIPLGADVEEFTKIADASNIIEKHNLTGREILLTVGRLCERKGQDIVIKALSEIKKNHENILYIVAGIGKLTGELDLFIKQNNLEENILFTGYVEKDDLPKYYQVCDIFLLPSRVDQNGDVEGFGIVLIEANLKKKPVIGTKDCGIEDAIIDRVTGYLVEQNNVEAIAKTCIKLLESIELRKELGENGYNRAINEYNWENVTKRTLQIIEKTTSKKC